MHGSLENHYLVIRIPWLNKVSVLFYSIFGAIPCCELEKFGWKCKLLRDWYLAEQARRFVYVIYTK